ncbi:unnamed protein product [Haemonchus placei]|uniref:Phlebovirus_G2 domain-containing protein n=1 Tax=Haemonchus placei TaxID=6290 RepID=A0A0N4WHB8_HAEPC|nr:unnamed protein product [Haemonchus placei]
MPVIPLLGTVFLGSVDSNHSEVAIIEEEDFFALRCSNLRSASNISECYVQYDHGRVLEAMHSAAVDLTLSTSAMRHAESIIGDENCDITSTSLQGCYNCLRGAEVTLSCYRIVRS